LEYLASVAQISDDITKLSKGIYIRSSSCFANKVW
jgi:hypothetical protein